MFPWRWKAHDMNYYAGMKHFNYVSVWLYIPYETKTLQDCDMFDIFRFTTLSLLIMPNQ